MLAVYTEVVLEPNIAGDCRKAFLDDPQWPEHINDPQLKQIKRRTSSNMIILEFFLINYSSSNRFETCIVNYNCSLKCIEKQSN